MKRAYLIKVDNKHEGEKITNYIEKFGYSSNFHYTTDCIYFFLIPSNKLYYHATISFEKLEKLEKYSIVINNTCNDFINSGILEANELGLFESMAGLNDDINNTISQNNKSSSKGKIFKTLRDYIKHISKKTKN